MAPPHRRAELHFRLAIHLSILADWRGDLSYLTQAIDEARLALAAVTRATRERRPAIQLALADMVTELVAGGGAGIEALAEAERLAEGLRRDSDVETRAQAWFVLIAILRLRRAADADPAEFGSRFDAARREAIAPAPPSLRRIWLATRLGVWAAEEGHAASAAWAYGEALATARRLSAAGRWYAGSNRVRWRGCGAWPPRRPTGCWSQASRGRRWRRSSRAGPSCSVRRSGGRCSSAGSSNAILSYGHIAAAAQRRPLVRQLPRSGAVCLIPAGDLGLLPLHAAGAAEAPALVWTYAPSAQALGHATEAARQPVPPASRALLVTMSGAGVQRLRYSRSVAPVLRRHLAMVTPLEDHAAEREAVLASLTTHAVLHFTCHGAADGEDPLESYLQLSNGRVTVRDLLDRRLRARLAVLAACETGVPYAQLPDEVIGLPAALLEAGVPGVVGTLWPVEELPTLLLTARFYELWLGQGADPASALHHAQHWLRSSTAGDLEAYARQQVDPAIQWPVRTAGRARQSKIFAHPDCWAAFAYTGV